MNDALGRVLVGETKALAFFEDSDGLAHQFIIELLQEHGLDTNRYAVVRLPADDSSSSLAILNKATLRSVLVKKPDIFALHGGGAAALHAAVEKICIDGAWLAKILSHPVREGLLLGYTEANARKFVERNEGERSSKKPFFSRVSKKKVQDPLPQDPSEDSRDLSCPSDAIGVLWPGEESKAAKQVAWAETQAVDQAIQALHSQRQELDSVAQYADSMIDWMKGVMSKRPDEAGRVVPSSSA